MNFLIRLFSPIILIISIILFIYTYYKAEIIWNGEKGEFYLTYYTFSISLFFISLITFFLNKSIKEYLILILISITAGLYIFESFLSFKQYLHLNSKVKQYKFKKIQFYNLLLFFEGQFESFEVKNSFSVWVLSSALVK